VLEQVKHLFAVEGIVFVLAVDKGQLENAVKGYYGSAELNASEYLRRFIDLEFTLPEPSIRDFCSHLFTKYDFKSFFHSKTRLQYEGYKDDTENFLHMCFLLFEHGHLSLRQQEKIFIHARIAVMMANPGLHLFPAVFVFLVFLKFVHPQIYQQIQRLALSPSEMLQALQGVYPAVADTNEAWSFYITETLFVYLYNNDYRQKTRTMSLLTVKNKTTQKEELVFESNFKQFYKDDEIIDKISSFGHKYDYSGIKPLLDKIDLTQPLTEP
jgi:hypothetical protein